MPATRNWWELSFRVATSVALKRIAYCTPLAHSEVRTRDRKTIVHSAAGRVRCVFVGACANEPARARGGHYKRLLDRRC